MRNILSITLFLLLVSMNCFSNDTEEPIIVNCNSTCILQIDSTLQNTLLNLNENILSISHNISPQKENSSNISKDVLATIIITILIFLLGGLVSFLYDEWKKRKNIRDFRDIIFSGIRLNENQINSNIQNLDNLMNNITNGEDMQPQAFKYSPTVGFEKLNTIEFEKYIANFVLNSKNTQKPDLGRDEINNLINSINYLARSEDLVMEQYNRYNNMSYKLFDECNNLYTKLINHYEDKRKAGEVDNPLYEQLKVIVDNYVVELNKDENKEKSATVLFTYLIAPIENEIIKYEEIDIELRRFITNFKIIQRQWDSYKRNFPLIFSDYKNNIITTYDKLKNSMSYFQEKTKPKYLP